jgi:hypothetical protein
MTDTKYAPESDRRAHTQLERHLVVGANTYEISASGTGDDTVRLHLMGWGPDGATVGEISGGISPLDLPAVAEALTSTLAGLVALRAERHSHRATTGEDRPKRHPNQGARWSAEDDERLLTRWGEGAGDRSLMQEFGRSRGGIRARLESLGAIQPGTTILYRDRPVGGRPSPRPQPPTQPESPARAEPFASADNLEPAETSAPIESHDPVRTPTPAEPSDPAGPHTPAPAATPHDTSAEFASREDNSPALGGPSPEDESSGTDPARSPLTRTPSGLNAATEGGDMPVHDPIAGGDTSTSRPSDAAVSDSHTKVISSRGIFGAGTAPSRADAPRQAARAGRSEQPLPRLLGKPPAEWSEAAEWSEIPPSPPLTGTRTDLPNAHA